MKILHILDHSIPLHSGYTFRTRAIIENQRKLGWQTEHLTSPKHNIATKNDITDEIVDELHFYRALPESGFLSKLPVLNQWAIVTALEKRLEEIIDEVKPDVLHAHSPALNGLAAVRVGKRYNIPVVYEIRAFWEDAAVDHGTTTEDSLRYKLTKMLETHVIKRADAVTTICNGLRSDIVSRGITEDKVTVIPNAVDLEYFTFGKDRDESLSRQLGLEDATVLGFIGSFYSYEGLSLLLDALPSIVNESPKLRVLLVGGGPQESLLKQKVNDLELQERVIFTGRVPHDQVQRYYELVDIFVYPRLSMRLTDLVTPLKPLEAMAQGRLVIASDVGGHHELIRDGENGILFKAGDAVSLADRVINLLLSRESWAGIRKVAREYVEEERNWPKSVENYQPVYAKLLAK